MCLCCAQVYLSSHFVQPNSIEFGPALEWRRLQAAVRDAKRQLRNDHAANLSQLMRAYLRVCPSSAWKTLQNHNIVARYARIGPSRTSDTHIDTCIGLIRVSKPKV